MLSAAGARLYEPQPSANGGAFSNNPFAFVVTGIAAAHRAALRPSVAGRSLSMDWLPGLQRQQLSAARSLLKYRFFQGAGMSNHFARLTMIGQTKQLASGTPLLCPLAR